MDLKILDILGDCICIINKDSQIVYANKALLDLCGLKKEDIVGRECFEVFHHCPKECEECYLADIICPKKAAYEGKVISVVHTHFMPDGTERLFDIKASPLRDEDGNIIGLIEVLRDITEKERAKEELEKSEKKLRLIASALGEGLYVLDGQGKLIFMNQEAERLLGWTEAELLGKSIHEIIHFKKADGTPLPAEECPILNVYRTGEKYYSSYFSEEIFIRKDGNSFPVAFIATPIIDDERIIGVVAVFRDITIRKRMKEDILNLEKFKSIADLAGGIAHDFNNLLTAIMGYVSLSKMYLDPEDKIYNYLTIAENACISARNLTYQMLLFAKGEKPSKKIIETKRLLKDTAASSIKDSIYKIQFLIPDDLWLIEVDEGQIRQVIHNLVVNACEAMPDGGTILISAENVDVTSKDELPLNKGRYVKISVKDHGVGIKREDLPRIFDPYFTTKQIDFHKGVGLGLAVCYSIIKRHDGHIFAESELGKGTTLHVLIPAAEIKKEEAKAICRGRVLLVEDEEMVGHIATEMLHHLGYYVDFVREGEQAIKLYKKSLASEEPYELVMLDLTVQRGMGGKETIKRLLEIDPDVKAVISSGYADDPVMVNYRDFGFRYAIAKPYDIEQIKEAIHKAIEG